MLENETALILGGVTSQDRWRCSQGKYATFRKIKYQKNHPDKLYYTRRSDCKGCPLAAGCIGKSHEKRISMTVYKDYYDRALERAKSRKGQYYKTIRQSTVEPVFGTLINYTGMRKINTRGIESANKVMLMAAIAYNLKKLMKQGSSRTSLQAQRALKEGLYLVRSTVELLFRQIAEIFGIPDFSFQLPEKSI